MRGIMDFIRLRKARAIQKDEAERRGTKRLHDRGAGGMRSTPCVERRGNERLGTIFDQSDTS